MSDNRAAIKETLAALGPMSYGPLQEAANVPDGSFGRNLRELVKAGEVERDDRDYRLPRAEAQTRHYCAACGAGNTKTNGRMDLSECPAA